MTRSPHTIVLYVLKPKQLCKTAEIRERSTPEVTNELKSNRAEKISSVPGDEGCKTETGAVFSNSEDDPWTTVFNLLAAPDDFRAKMS